MSLDVLNGEGERGRERQRQSDRQCLKQNVPFILSKSDTSETSGGSAAMRSRTAASHDAELSRSCSAFTRSSA